MRRFYPLIMLLIMVFALTACKVSESDVKKADYFLEDLSAYSSSDVISELDNLANLTASVIKLPAQAFDFTDWDTESHNNKKYIKIFDSDATLYVKTGSGKVDRVAYTFRVSSVKDLYKAADTLIKNYGEPMSVYLNEVSSSHSAVDDATNSSDDPELTYSYVWKTKLQGQVIYIYEAYYNASGTNFAYVVISDFLSVADSAENKFWD